MPSVSRVLPAPARADPQPVTPRSLRLLMVDATPSSSCLNLLANQFDSTAVTTVAAAVHHLGQLQPDIVVTELAFDEGNGIEICRLARARPRPPLVIVTTALRERVPAVLQAGCSSVLLKPYAPNLLCARIGRLLSASGLAMRLETGSLQKRRTEGFAGITTNQISNDIDCPQCHRRGPTSFDFADHRRMWCACLTCDHVWLARRRE